MDNCDTFHGTRIKVLLTDDELQFPAIDELISKYKEWVNVSKESGGGRKTRSANRKADTIYEEIMAFKLPPIKIIQQAPSIVQSETPSVQSDTSTSETSLGPRTRSLRPRSRTPTLNTPRQPTRPITSPSTPTHQRIRAHMKKAASGGTNTSTTKSVLSKALEEEHSSVKLPRIRQLLRPDSVQKKKDEKREEEKERQTRLMLDRKAKEERAEAQKKQLLEERAVTAKQKREQRIQHAAELRKAREEAKVQQKLREQEARKLQLAEEKFLAQQQQNQPQQHQQPPTASVSNQKINHQVPVEKPSDETFTSEKANQNGTEECSQPQVPKTKTLNQTFKKPVEDADNIDISIQDETNDEESKRDKVPKTAVWTRAPYFREAIIEQFSKSDKERHREVLKLFPAVKLPVELEQIFGSSKAVNNRYQSRTSSAVWSPPHRATKRTSSMLTPTANNS